MTFSSGSRREEEADGGPEWEGVSVCVWFCSPADHFLCLLGMNHPLIEEPSGEFCR